jgi:hypothetical protein
LSHVGEALSRIQPDHRSQYILEENRFITCNAISRESLVYEGPKLIVQEPYHKHCCRHLTSVGHRSLAVAASSCRRFSKSLAMLVKSTNHVSLQKVDTAGGCACFQFRLHSQPTVPRLANCASCAFGLCCCLVRHAMTWQSFDFAAVLRYMQVGRCT